MDFASVAEGLVQIFHPFPAVLHSRHPFPAVLHDHHEDPTSEMGAGPDILLVRSSNLPAGRNSSQAADVLAHTDFVAASVAFSVHSPALVVDSHSDQVVAGIADHNASLVADDRSFEEAEAHALARQVHMVAAVVHLGLGGIHWAVVARMPGHTAGRMRSHPASLRAQCIDRIPHACPAHIHHIVAAGRRILDRSPVRSRRIAAEDGRGIACSWGLAVVVGHSAAFAEPHRRHPDRKP